MKEYIELLLGLNDFHWQGSPYQWFFYAGIVLTLIFEKRRMVRIVFAWVPLLFLVCLFNPLSIAGLKLAGVFNRAYFVRLFSFMPLMYVIAMGMTMLVRIRRPWVKLAVTGLLGAAIAFAGHNVYRESWLTRAENPEKVPSEILEIIDEIESRDGEDVSIAAISAGTIYLRQVADVVMPYGRYVNELGKLLASDPPDVAKAMQMAGQQDVDYVVAHNLEATLSAFAEAGYAPIMLTQSYAVFEVSGVPRTHRRFNDKRQVVAVSDYDAQGQLKTRSDGVATVAYDYDSRGNKAREYYLDANGNRTVTAQGYASVYRTFYASSNRTRTIAYADLDDNPVLVSGRYGTRFTYDGKALLIREDYLDQQGRLMNRTDATYASRLLTYDENKRVIGERYLDADGRPVAVAAGYASFVREYDRRDRVRREAYFDTEGKPMRLAAGYASFTRSYDKAGNVISEAYFDEEGAPVMSRAGYQRLEREYDENRRIVREAYWNGRRPVTRPEGYASLTREYDARGNMIRESYFDGRGRPALKGGSYASICRIYDDQDRLVEEYCLDRAGKSTRGPSGYALVTFIRDESNRAIRERYYDEYGMSLTLDFGYAEVRRVFDGDGHILEEAYFTPSGEPVANYKGYAVVRRQYDDRGNVTQEYYLDPKGEPVACKLGYFRTRRTYNDDDQMILEEFMDAQGAPMDVDNGCVAVAREYTEAGDCTRELCLDRAGKPVNRANGICETQWTYNARRQLVKTAYFDADGNPAVDASGAAVIEQEYDGDTVVRELRWDREGQPLNGGA